MQVKSAGIVFINRFVSLEGEAILYLEHSWFMEEFLKNYITPAKMACLNTISKTQSRRRSPFGWGFFSLTWLRFEEQTTKKTFVARITK